MKNLILALIALIGISASAQIEKNIGDFTEIKASNRIKVELIPSLENKVIVETKDEKSVDLTNKNGKLTVRNNLKELVSEDVYNVIVRVYYNQLEKLDAESGSYILTSKAIESKNLKLYASIGSKIEVKINSENIEATGHTGATIKIEGNAKTGTFISNSGASIQSKELKISELSATVNAGGKLDVTATDKLNAKVRAGGSINIYGNPKNVTEKIVAGGSINRIK